MSTFNPNTPILQTPSFLFLGPPGSHKTTLAMQFPRPHFLDCDENLGGPSRFLTKGPDANKPGIGAIRPDLTFTYDSIRFDPITKRPLALDEMWDNYIRCFEKAVNDKSVGTIVTDSLTGLDEFCLLKTCREAGLDSVAKLDRQHWIPFRNRIKTLTIRMRQTGKINIVCCHQENKYRKDGSIEKIDVTMSSKLADHFGWVFTDVWRFIPEPPLAGEHRPAMLECTTNPICATKNSYGIPGMIPASWAEVNKYLKLE